MFGSKRQAPVGAAAKLEAAKKFRNTTSAALSSTRGRGHGSGDTVALTIIFCMAAGLAYLLMERVAGMEKLPFRLPHAVLHKWLVAMPPPSVMGDTDMDFIIAVLLRGSAILAVAGVVPGLATLLQGVDRRKDGSSAVFLLWLASALFFMAAAVAVRIWA